MSTKKISQAEARRLKNRVKFLEDQHDKLLDTWSYQYPPGGVHLATFAPTDRVHGRLEAAKMLGAPLVAKLFDGGLYVYAIKR